MRKKVKISFVVLVILVVVIALIFVFRSCSLFEAMDIALPWPTVFMFKLNPSCSSSPQPNQSPLAIALTTDLLLPYGLMNSACPKFRADNRSTGRIELEGPKKPEILWRYKTGGEIHNPPSLDKDSNIYFGSYDSSFYALTPEGKLKWKTKLDEWVDSTAALDRSGNVYVGNDDGYLIAFSKDGKILWKYNLDAEISSSPAITPEGLIIVGSENGKLYGFTPDGKPQFTFGAKNRILVSSPVISPDGKIIVGSEDGHIYCINKDGSLNWKYKGKNTVVFNSPPLMDKKGNIYFAVPGSDKESKGTKDRKKGSVSPIVSLDSKGQERWTLKLHEEVAAPMSLDDEGRLYGIALDGVIFCISPEGKMINKDWIGERPGGEMEDGPKGGPILDKNNLMYIPGKSKLYCYKRLPQKEKGKSVKFEKLWEVSAPSGEVFSTSPVIGPGKKIFIGTEKGSILCIGDKD